MDRDSLINQYILKLKSHDEWEDKVRNRRLLLNPVRVKCSEMMKKYDKSEDMIKSLETAGQLIGEVLKRDNDERC